VSSAVSPKPFRRDRAELRAEVERRKAARDARDVEIAELCRREQVGQRMYSLDELKKLLGWE